MACSTSLVEQVGPGGFCADRCDAAIATLLTLHGTVYGISLIFFGIYCILIGWLIVRSRAIPIAVGIAMMVGGSVHLVTKTAGLLDTDLAFPTLLNVLPLLGEASLAIWLLLFGMRKMPHDRLPLSDGTPNNGLSRSAFQ